MALQPIRTSVLLRWQQRLVFVFATDESAAEAARSRLVDADTAIRERHITWFVVRDGDTASNHEGVLDPGLGGELERRYRRGGALQSTEVVLVGKDGGVKYRATALDLPAIFAEIDRMPMRRQEMRDSTSGS